MPIPSPLTPQSDPSDWKEQSTLTQQGLLKITTTKFLSCDVCITEIMTLNTFADIDINNKVNGSALRKLEN